MARQLLTGVLDIQLQQLEENGLKQLPLYRDISHMRKNIGALVDKEMRSRRSNCFVKCAAAGPRPSRDAAFHQARQMIRKIVTRLATERQNLLRRLKSAEIAAQVQRLIDIETKVWETTRTIPDQLPARQEGLALAAIEDQGDVKQLFLQLVETLAGRQPAGADLLGTGARTEGLQILVQAAGVGQPNSTRRATQLGWPSVIPGSGDESAARHQGPAAVAGKDERNAKPAQCRPAFQRRKAWTSAMN